MYMFHYTYYIYTHTDKHRTHRQAHTYTHTAPPLFFAGARTPSPFTPTHSATRKQPSQRTRTAHKSQQLHTTPQCESCAGGAIPHSQPHPEGAGSTPPPVLAAHDPASLVHAPHVPAVATRPGTTRVSVQSQSKKNIADAATSSSKADSVRELTTGVS